MNEQNIPQEGAEFDPIVTMTDEDGNDVEFEFLDIVEYNGKEYAILLPVADDDGMVVIFRIEPVEGSPDEETYIGVDDEDEAEAVFQIFQAENADEYDFT
ncbi:MAG: DUF1292 domain-containing protein [Clostridia bacterium]|nr:DUF1292 domain-containing protein [Clostridia bacterium]